MLPLTAFAGAPAPTTYTGETQRDHHTDHRRQQGLGHEIARRLVQAGQTVWIGARDAENGRKAADRLGADFVQLDVTDDASVDAAVKTLRARVGHLDILINNAGILGEVTAPEDMTVDQIGHVYETNVFGLVRVTHAFLPLLRKAAAPSVVNVTSGSARSR